MEKEIQNELDFAGHMVNIEDAENVPLPLSDNKTLSDNELEQAGLVKTSAFVRTKRSKNALRLEKHKEKKEEQGIKQLNIEVPKQYRDVFKAMAKELSATGTISGKQLEILPVVNGNNKEKKPTKTPVKAPESDSKAEQINYDKIVERVNYIRNRGGLRAFLLNKLI